MISDRFGIGEITMYMSKKFAISMVCASMAYSQVVLADGPSTVAAVYRNMANSGIEFQNARQQNTKATPTLVRGIYKLTVQPFGNFLGYTNEGGTIISDPKGWDVLGGPLRKMNSDELAELRGEIIRNIDLDKLIKIEYGNGGGRNMVMFSAIDCPFCKKFEVSAAKFAPRMNATFYVVPSSLRSVGDGVAGQQSWRAVTNIWCAKDNAYAWHTYWLGKNPTSAQNCAFDERRAEEMGDQLNSLLSSVGINRRGVPAIMREDGTVFTPKPDFDKSYAESIFGPLALSNIKSAHDGSPPKWLANMSDALPDAKPADAKPLHINIGDVLQNLLRN